MAPELSHSKIVRSGDLHDLLLHQLGILAKDPSMIRLMMSTSAWAQDLCQELQLRSFKLMSAAWLCVISEQRQQQAKAGIWVLPPPATDSLLINGGLKPTKEKVLNMMPVVAPASVLTEGNQAC